MIWQGHPIAVWHSIYSDICHIEHTIKSYTGSPIAASSALGLADNLKKLHRQPNCAIITDYLCFTGVRDGFLWALFPSTITHTFLPHLPRLELLVLSHSLPHYNWWYEIFHYATSYWGVYSYMGFYETASPRSLLLPFLLSAPSNLYPLYHRQKTLIFCI